MPYDFQCPKCQNDKFELGEMRGFTGNLTPYLDMENVVFTVVSCDQCGFSEMFRKPLDTFMQIHRVPSQ